MKLPNKTISAATRWLTSHLTAAGQKVPTLASHSTRLLKIGIGAMTLTLFGESNLDAKNIGVKGGNSSTVGAYLQTQGHTITYNPSSYTGLDIVILMRTDGDSNLISWVQAGGILITEWTGADWALNTANLINADVTGPGLYGTNSLVTFTSDGLAGGLGTSMPNPYSEYDNTDFFREIGNVGTGVKILATRPGNIPCIVSGRSGNGGVLALDYDWGDSPGTLTFRLLNNLVAFRFGPTTQPATSLTTTSATLNGAVNPNGLTTTAWFEWGTSPTLVGATSTTAVSVGSGSSNVAINHTLTSLTPETTYYFRAMMNNSAGTQQGSILSFYTGAEIAVEQPVGTNLVDGAATVAFDDALISSASAAKTFTIKNSGSLPLTGLTITKDGANAADFTVSSLGSTTVATGGSTTFTVTVTPSALGARSAALHIASNDADENPFDINLTANGVATLPLPAYTFTNSTNPQTYNNYTFGSRFTVNTACSVSSLGVYDHNQDGISGNVQVGLWNSAGTLLASTTVSNANPLVGVFRYNNITPVPLSVGQSYIIGALTNGVDPTAFNTPNFVVDSRITYNEARYNSENGFTFPSNTNGAPLMGAGMQLSAPASTNVAPTDIALSTTSVAENLPSGTTVATISGTDPDAGQSATLTFSLVAGAGDTGNASFSIDGTTLKTAAAFNFETKPSYSIRLRATDTGSPGLTYEEVFTISITNVNEAATDITLTPASLAENNAASATVGTLAAVDADAGDSHSFSLVSGAGDTDNASFSITGTTLQISPVTNFEAKSTYSIRVQARDAANADYAKALTVTITDANEMPSFVKGADLSQPALIMTEQDVSGWATAISDGDPEAVQSLSFNVTVTSGAGIFLSLPAISEDGTLSYTLNGTVGTAFVSVTLTDDASIHGTPALTTAAQTFTIHGQEAASTGHTFDATTGVSSGGFIYRPYPGVINNNNDLSFKAVGQTGSGGFTSANDSLLISNVSGEFLVIGQEASTVAGGGALSGAFSHLLLTPFGSIVAADKFTGALAAADQGYLMSVFGRSLDLLSREGDTAPDGGIFTGHTGRPLADEAENIYIPGTVSGVATTKNSGVWHESRGGLHGWAIEGDDVSSIIGTPAWLGNFSAPLSAAGSGLTFVAALQNNPDNAAQKTATAGNAAILTTDADSLRLVARKGHLIPTVGRLSTFSGVSRSSQGDNAFLSLLAPSTVAPIVSAANDQVLMAVIGGATHVIARENTTDITGSLKPTRFGSFYITTDAAVIYQAWLTGPGVTTSNDSVLCRWTVAGGTQVLAREGDAAPGTGGSYLAFQALSVSNGGAVVLQSSLSNGIALMRALPGAGLSLVIRTGTSVTYEGSPRTVLSLGIHATGTGAGGGGGGFGAAINDSGAVFTVLSIGSSQYLTRVYHP